MKVGIIGTGYVGLPTGVGLAELGNTVVCVDKIKENPNLNNILPLLKDDIPLHEGLQKEYENDIQYALKDFHLNSQKFQHIDLFSIVIEIMKRFEFVQYHHRL